MPRLHITTAICTWNRSRSLGATLASLQRLKVPSDINWEVLVINNNCTDDTDAVLTSFADCLPLSVVREPRQGTSHARNRAVEAARGDYILWTDDDVEVDPGWLAAYVEAFRTWPEAAVFGGPITPKLKGTPPPWLVRAAEHGTVSAAYAKRDLGESPIVLDAETGKIPYGANYAVRMEEQRKFSYDPRFGISKGDNLRGEETILLGSILKSGYEGRWVPDACVDHIIPEERQTEAYIRAYYVGHGRFIVRHRTIATEPTPPLPPVWLLWLKCVLFRFTYYATRFTASPVVWCAALRRLSIARGIMIELGRLNAAPEKSKGRDEARLQHGQSTSHRS